MSPCGSSMVCLLLTSSSSAFLTRCRRVAALEGDLRDLRLIPHPRTPAGSDEESDGNGRYHKERVHVRRSYRD